MSTDMNNPDRMKNRAILAGGIAAIALVVAACADAAGPNESTVDNGYTEVQITSPVSVEPEKPEVSTTTAPPTRTEDIIGYQPPQTRNPDAYDPPEPTSEYDQAEQIFLLQMDNYDIECGSDDSCLEAGYVTCMFLMQGGDAEQLYAEIAMDPGYQILPQVSNMELPAVMGVAEASICEAL